MIRQAVVDLRDLKGKVPPTCDCVRDPQSPLYCRVRAVRSGLVRCACDVNHFERGYDFSDDFRISARTIGYECEGGPGSEQGPL